MPDFLFPSLANAVILRGGVPVFVDVNPEDLNLDVAKVGLALSGKTRAIAPIHYAGVPAAMDEINRVAGEGGLWVVEDAAQAVGNWRLSGDFGCVSFHETKNLGLGEGGCLVVPERLAEAVELLVDCGTTKARWRRGEASGYDWLGVGTSALMSPRLIPELGEKFSRLSEITASRVKSWKVYAEAIDLPCASRPGNGHIFWFLTPRRDEVKAELARRGVRAASHYEAASTTAVGRRYGRSVGITHAPRIAAQILRLPTDVDEARAAEIADIVNEVTNAKGCGLQDEQLREDA